MSAQHPGNPYYAGSPLPQYRRRKNPIGCVLTFLLVALLAGVLLYLFLIKPEEDNGEPVQLAVDFYGAIAAHDFTRAFSYVDTSGLRIDNEGFTLTSPQRLANYAQHIDQVDGTISSPYQFTDFRRAANDPNSSVITVTLQRQKIGHHVVFIYVKKTADNLLFGTWKIIQVSDL